MTEIDGKDLSDIIERVTEDKDSIKEAVQTLHPKEDKKGHFTQSDRLAIFNDAQIDAAAVLEWQDKAMQMSFDEFKKKNITEGFTEKVKALTVSKEGQGRAEIPGVMQPKIIGDMIQQGMMPMQPQPVSAPQKTSFLRKLIGGR